MRKIFLSLVSATAISAPAFAQQASIEEITVTARKRDETLLEIPVAVTALSNERLKEADIKSAQDLSNFVPGFTFENTTGSAGRANSPDIRFRGIRQQAAVPTQQVGAIFWDGSYIGAGAGILPFGDLERVEVIKGPQTAYFGRNTFSGAVNFIPAEPGDTFGGNVELSYSPSYDDGYSAAVAAGGPITEKLGARVYVSHERDGGDYEYGDGTAHGRVDNTSLTSVLTLQATDNFRLKASGYYVDGDETYSGVSVAFTVPARQCRRTFSGELINVVTGQRTPFTRDLSLLNIGTFCGTIPRGDNILIASTQKPTVAQTIGGAAALTGLTDKNPLLTKYDTLPKMPGGFGGSFQARRLQIGGEYEFLNGHTLNVMASQAFTGINQTFDLLFGSGSAPGGDKRVNPVGNHVYMREHYYEARITSPQDGSFRYMLGVSDYAQRYRNGASGNRLTVNFENNSTSSIFGSIDYDITEQLTLSLEGRYLDEESLVIVNGNPNVFNPQVVTRNELSAFDDFIPRAILSYRPFDATTIYASYSASTLIGVQTNARRVSELDPQTIPDPSILGDFTPPQKNTAIEIGWKQQFEKWAFALSGYHMDWKNQVLRTTILAGNQTTSFGQPGDSKYLGSELEIFANPTEWLEIGGGLTWIDAKLKNYSTRGSFEQAELTVGLLSVVNDGNRPALIAEWSGSMNAKITGELLDREVFLRSDVIWESASYFDNSEYNRSKGAVKLNLRAGVEIREDTTLEAAVTNVTNNKALPSGSTTNGVGGRATFGPPPERRRVSVRLRSKF